jgi:hypothetical protein
LCFEIGYLTVSGLQIVSQSSYFNFQSLCLSVNNGTTTCAEWFIQDFKSGIVESGDAYKYSLVLILAGLGYQLAGFNQSPQGPV